MFRVNLEVKEGTDVKEFISQLKKQKEITKITVPKKKKPAKKMTDYYTVDGKQLSVTEFKKRIKKSENSIKNGKGYSTEDVLKEIKGWKKNSK